REARPEAFPGGRDRAKVERLRSIADGISKRALVSVSATEREKLLDLLTVVRRNLASKRPSEARTNAEERTNGRV
ncbi:MAG: hypothetical protein ACRETU_00805, partial [Steroidobacterales bacterium]